MGLAWSACGTAPSAFLPGEILPVAPVEPSPHSDSSNLDSLLASNDVPLDSDIFSIQSILSTAHTQIDALDSQIDELEVALDKLDRRRDRLEERARQHRAILSPLRRMPPEVVGDIFAMIVCDQGKPLWYLAQICRSWRRTAVAYPFLWNSIAIPNSTHSMLPMIQTQLLRSANVLLNVRWAASSEAQKPVDTHSRDAILAECSRWGSLALDAENDADFDWLRPVAGCLAALRKFDLRSNPYAQVTFPEIFSGASELREVYITDRAFNSYSPATNVPWGQITLFRGAYDPDTLRAILAATSNLEQCAISFIGESDPRSIITMLHLRRLCVENSKSLVHLTAPLLEELFTAYNPAVVELLPILSSAPRVCCKHWS
ncbi:hypothetical protein DFH06DRAFT_1054928 [Mycena polygramma]|nr:hypothetical protein DFH06DRAFT_1054928 [Mycena polygramma]